MSKKKSSHKKKSYSFKGRPITVCSRKKESKFSSVLVWVVRLLIWVPIVLALNRQATKKNRAKYAQAWHPRLLNSVRVVMAFMN